MSTMLLLQAMYENLLVELPLAPFFLSKILGNVDCERLHTNNFATGQGRWFSCPISTSFSLVVHIVLLFLHLD